MGKDFISDDEFKPDEEIKGDITSPSPDFVPDSKFISDDDQETLKEEKYGSLGQQAITGLEGAAQGMLGPIAPAIERGLGVKPEDIRGRQEENPITHGLSEAGGFGVGMLTGTGEAALLTKAGQGVANLAKLSEPIGLAQKMASGATKAATELALLQSGDEATKAIVEDPDAGIGNAAANIGMAALLGGVGGPALIGLGSGVKYGLDKVGLKEFADRLAYRGANANPNEMFEHELENTINTYHEIGSELGGVQGLKSQALGKIMPEINEKIAAQVPETISMLEKAAEKMEAKPFKYGARVPGMIREAIADFQKGIEGDLSSGKIFDSLNSIKKDIDLKIPFGSEYGEAYSELSKVNGAIRKNLENHEIWGDVGKFQKEVNAAWSSAIGPAKDIEKAFMSKVGDRRVIDIGKIESYIKQGGNKSYETLRQAKVRKFVDGIENLQKALDSAAAKAGVDHSIEPMAMGYLKESLQKPSVGARFADLWYDKVGAQALGSGAGAAVGSVLGGIPGAFIAKEILGPVFGAMIQPIVEKTANLSAFQQTMKFGKAIVDGNNKLNKAAVELFSSGSKPLLLNAIPDDKKIDSLDEKLKDLENNPNELFKISGDLSHYAPAHSEALAKTAQNAINYLNSQRPRPIKANPLDDDIEPSKAEKSQFNRTLSIAQSPLSTLKFINDGTLMPQDVKTLATVYPAYYKKMSESLMFAMTDHLSKGESVPYKKSQSLSLFIGRPLDSTMTPMSIQSAQQTFIRKNQQLMPGGAPKKSTSKLDNISKNLQTPSQRSEAIRNKG